MVNFLKKVIIGQKSILLALYFKDSWTNEARILVK